MTEQSTQSSKQSETGGRAYSSRMLEANARLLGKRADAERNQPQPIGASIQKILKSRSSNSSDSLVIESGIPLRHRRLFIEDPPAEWAAARDGLCKRIGSGFLVGLIGTRGTGKTQLATEAVLHASVCKRPSRYLRAMQVFLELRATYSAPDQSELDVIERLRTPGLLIIDEMQERGETAWEDRILNHVIDLRYGDCTDTILIANLDPCALQESLGESISSRLLETGGVIECNWGSFRKVKCDAT